MVPSVGTMAVGLSQAEKPVLDVPAYRTDVQRPCDVVEDILRIYGYNNVEIPTQLKSSLTVQTEQDAEYRLQNLVGEQLVGCGFYEIMNNSLTKVSYYEQAGLNAYPWEQTVKVVNPLSADLGMGVTYLDPSGSQIGKKESIADTARVLGRMFDGIEYRGYGQQIVEELAHYASVPVWNGLTNEFHPTQIIADMLTIKEQFGHLKGINLVYMGDARYNMGNSLMVG